MTEPKCRPFLMSDAMILIAATAVGFAGARGFSSGEGSKSDWLMWCIFLTIALLPAWSIALVLLSLRKPSPSWGALRPQPGWIACVAGGIPSTSFHLLYALLTVFGRESAGPFFHYSHGTLPGAFCVSAVWLVMGLDRGWKPGQGWIDRCGIVIGSLWVAVLVVPLCLACLATFLMLFMR